MTTLKVNLSAQLQTALSSQGVYAYAVYFDPNNNGAPVWHNLVVDGAVQTSGTVDIALPTELKGGKIYFLVQSRDAGEPANLPTVITQESDINFGNAADQDFRYDSFEVTLEGSANDVGNLTSVNGFGLPMEVSVTYSDGSTDTRGYKVSANDLFQAFQDAGNAPVLYTEGPLNGQNRGVISPSEALAQVPPNTTFKASDWDTYIASLQVDDPSVEIAGFFNGAADANGVYHNAGFFSYTLEWDSAESAFWLSPAANSEIKGFIKITPADLANSIYSTLGDVGIYASKTDTEPYRILNNTDFATGEYSMNTGENNQWGAVLANFLTGFTAGFYGTSGKSLNPLDTAAIDLNDNWNWDPSYAFSKNLTAPPDPTSHFQDAYSEFFFFNSNSYGSGYSDNLMRQYSVGGPLIDVSNPTEPNKGQNVSEIGITLFADNETPSGYVTPQIYNYIAPDGGKYVAIDGNTPTGNNIKFNFANARMVMSEDTAISLDMITGWTTGGEPIWTTITFDAPAGQSPWQNWTLVYTPDGQGGGTWSAAIAPNTSQGPGNLLISNFQTPEEGKYWYRLNIGEGADKKTYNLYYEAANDPDGKPQFLNPNVGSQQGGLAIDGLATIAGPAVTDPNGHDLHRQPALRRDQYARSRRAGTEPLGRGRHPRQAILRIGAIRAGGRDDCHRHRLPGPGRPDRGGQEHDHHVGGSNRLRLDRAERQHRRVQGLDQAIHQQDRRPEHGQGRPRLERPDGPVADHVRRPGWPVANAQPSPGQRRIHDHHVGVRGRRRQSRDASRVEERCVDFDCGHGRPGPCDRWRRIGAGSRWSRSGRGRAGRSIRQLDRS